MTERSSTENLCFNHGIKLFLSFADFFIMSFRVETGPNQYTDYEIYSVARINSLGQQLLSLLNPNYQPTPIETTTTPEEKPATPNEKKPTSNDNEAAPDATDASPNDTDAAPSEAQTTENENKATPNDNEIAIKKTVVSRHHIQQPSDLCRPRQEQVPYYIADQSVMKVIQDSCLPNQPVLPYIPPTASNVGHDEQLTTSMTDWQASKQSFESTRNLLSQIITIIQCRSTLAMKSLSVSAPSNRNRRQAVRLFIDCQKQQQQQMDSFLDIINEALLLESNTIKTLWDAKGEQVRESV